MPENPDPKDFAVFEAREPDPSLCCLCSTPAGPFTFEERPTGIGGRLQTWPFCQDCWSEYQASEASDLAHLVNALVDAVIDRTIQQEKPSPDLQTSAKTEFS